MLHVSTQKLIHKLYALTESGDIAWREGEGAAMVFDTEGYRVEVEGDPPSVRLLGADGKELESAIASDLAATRWPDGEGTFATHVSEMARQAQRIARGAEFAISRILSSLSAPPQKAPNSVLTDALNTQEPPPSPHTIPEPPVQAPRTETAVGKLFAINPAPPLAPTDTIESAPVEPEAEKIIEAAEDELPLEEIPIPAEPESVEPHRPPLPEPQFKTPVFAAPEPPPRPTPIRGGFGATQSFAIARAIKPKPDPIQLPASPSQAPRAEPPIEPKVTSTGLFITGISAVSRQTVGRDPAPERVAPPPAPTVQTPPPVPEPRREPAPASGPDIYKPWV
jgi:hypothetical protein